MNQFQWILFCFLILALLVFAIANECFANETMSRESAILEIVTPRKTRVSKLPYSSKRIQAYRNQIYRERLVKAFEAASLEFGLPVNLLIAIAYRETVFRYHAEGDGGERGIMQVKPFVVKRCKQYCRDNDTPEGGIWCGSCWFAKGVKSCDGDLEAGLSAYVSGRCKPMSRKVKMAVHNRVWLWKYLDKLTGEEARNE